MTEQDVPGLSVKSVMDILSVMAGKDMAKKLLNTDGDGLGSAIDLGNSLKSTIVQNRDNLQQTRIDIQQTRIESQQTRIDLSNFKGEFNKLFHSVGSRIDHLIELNNDRSNLLINEIKVICEEQRDIRFGKKRKLSATEEELLSLTDPHYVPIEEDAFGSHDESEQEEEEEEEEEVAEVGMDEESVTEVAILDQEQMSTPAPAPVSVASTAADTIVTPPTGAASTTTTKLPLYKMIRGAESIKLIWQEYTEGINDGPLVKDLELKYQGRWKDDTERKYFSYRKKLYQIIENMMKLDGKTAEEAIEFLEKFITDASGTRKSMTWLYDHIDDRYK